MDEPTVDNFDASQWRASSEYLFGVDLYNAKYFWESHEQWEAIWHATGRTGAIADFFKGLIKLSAAGVKKLEGNPAGAQRHLQRAVELFQHVGTSFDSIAGLQTSTLVKIAKQLEASESHVLLQLSME